MIESTGYSIGGLLFNPQWTEVFCNFSSTKSIAFFCPPQPPGTKVAHRHTGRQNTTHLSKFRKKIGNSYRM